MNEQNFNNIGQNLSNNLNEQPTSPNPEALGQAQVVNEPQVNTVSPEVTNVTQTVNTPETVAPASSFSNNATNTPVATPIPGTENNNMPNNMGSSIGQDPGGISLGSINNNGFQFPVFPNLEFRSNHADFLFYLFPEESWLDILTCQIQ